MIKKLLFTAALLMPGIAYAGAPSATLPGQIVPGSGIPNPVLMGWLSGKTLAQLKSEQPAYNMAALINLQTGSAAGSGAISLNLNNTYGGSSAALVSDIQAWHTGTDKRGQARKVLLTVTDDFGNGSFSPQYCASANATQFVNSLTSIVSTYGFDGIEFDLESGGGSGANGGPCGQGSGSTVTWEPTIINSIFSTLKTNLGANFLITQTPRPFEMGPSDKKRGYMATYDMTEPQNYYHVNDPVYNCTSILQDERGDAGAPQPGVKQFSTGSDGGTVVPNGKMIFGNNPDGLGDTPCTAAQFLSARNGVNTSFPGFLRGEDLWTVIVDSGTAYSYSSTFAAQFGL